MICSNTCCTYWNNKLNTNIDWKNVFLRNLVKIKENKLREFNFKILYNLLPVQKNLNRWGLVSDSNCKHCHMEEDVLHAFLFCDLNSPFLQYVKELLFQTFSVRLDISTAELLKLNTSNVKYDLILTLAFWCIYKMIVERNRTGVDRRYFNLRYVFKREIEKRMYISKTRQKKYGLPEDIVKFL